MAPSPSLLDLARQRLIILDSATGTGVQDLHLTPDDFGGLDGCNEYLNLCKPDVVRRMHHANLAVGVDGVKTNTFGANAVLLADYGIADQALEINRAAARIAREVVDGYSTPDRPRFVVGSIGPGAKLPSLGQIDFDTLYAAHHEQATGLLQGGVDVILIETVYDLLQAKAAIIAARDAMQEERRVPILVSVTIELNGQMLLGTEIGAAVTSLAALDIDALGINCATGPEQMHEHLRYLRDNSPLPIICQPNAGLPRLVDGQSVYDLTPAALADAFTTFVHDYGVSIAGGCCGTTVGHVKAVVDAHSGTVPPSREPHLEPGAASLFVSVPYHQDTSFLIIGERANANGSRHFKRLLSEDNFDEMANVVRDQAKDGAHIADLCVDFVGRDGVADMQQLVAAAGSRSTLPLMLDSTESPVLEAGLKLIGGKPLLNSINLEDGGQHLDVVLRAARRYGAGVVALVIDEEGQARTEQRKVEIAHRIYKIATEDYGLPPTDLFFDALTLPLGSGQEELRNDGVETLRAIRRIKAELPHVRTILGISNISFGLNAGARQVLNSVFLHGALEAGLDAAIINARQILPAHKIPQAQRDAAQRLIDNDWIDNEDPLLAFIGLFTDVGVQSEKIDLATVPLDERLHHRILDGLRDGLGDDLDDALRDRDALIIVNETLLPAMQVVGDRFASGEMQLPFVLQSAETMKAAVKHLEPHMEKSGAGGKGTVVLATVRGDVHDIGKNLVDIILSNNGYTIVNLGIKQPIQNIIDAAQQHNADAVGLSGLLVKSALVMKEDLQELNRRGLAEQFPVMVGGAALTRAYVEQDLRDVYDGRVYYGKDAFEGLAVMNALMDGREPEGQDRTAPAAVAAKRSSRTDANTDANTVAAPARARSDVGTDAPIPAPPFWGRRALTGISLPDVYPYLNEVALFRGQWGFRRGDLNDEQFHDLLEREARPVLRRLQDQAIAESLLQPAVVYGYFPVQSDGNDLIVYHTASADTAHGNADGETGPAGHAGQIGKVGEVGPDTGKEWLRFHFPRQAGKKNLCLADYYRPVESGEFDVAAFHVVTIGAKASEHAQTLFQNDSYQDYLFWHGFGVEMAEALAEYWHRRVRQELGIAAADGERPTDLFAGRYQGARFSFGYPACPNLEDQRLLFELLQPGDIGITLSEEFQLVPEQSTSAIITAHPEAAYFTI